MRAPSSILKPFCRPALVSAKAIGPASTAASRVSVRPASARSAVEARQGRVHVGIAYCVEPAPPIETVANHRKPVCVFATPDHPLAASGRPISLREAARYPIARMAMGFGLHHVVTRAAQAEGEAVIDRLVTNSLFSLREFAMLGLGISFMSARSAAADISAGRLVALPTTSRILNGTRVHVLIRSGRVHGRAVREVVQSIAEKSAEWRVEA